MGEPKLEDEIDEESISAEWATLAEGELSSSLAGEEEKRGEEDAEGSGELFANLERKPRRQSSLPPTPPSRQNMAAALTIVKGGQPSLRTPVPAPPSKSDLQALQTPPSRIPSTPQVTMRSTPPPAPSSRSVAPPPPSSAQSVSPPPAPSAAPAVEPEAPAPFLGESPLGAPPATPPLNEAPRSPGLPRVDATPPPPVMPALSVVSAEPPVAGKAEATTEGEDGEGDTWSEETPTHLWRGGKHGIPPHIAARAAKLREAAKAKSEAPSDATEGADARTQSGAIPPPPGDAAELAKLPPPPSVPRSRVATDPTPAGFYSIAPLAMSQPPPPRGGNRDLRTAILAMAAALVVGIVAVAVMVIPRGSFAATTGGALIVTVASTDNTAVGSLELFVDGTRRCESSPCRVDALAVGSHFVKVVAPGYEAMADRAVAVKSGEDAVLHISLSKIEAPAAKATTEEEAAAQPEQPGAAAAAPAALPASNPASEAAAPRAGGARPAIQVAPAAPPAKGTINISSTPPANIIVDGTPLGMTPKTVRVKPGAHTIVFAGPKGRKVRSVNVQPGGSSSVGVTF